MSSNRLILLAGVVAAGLMVVVYALVIQPQKSKKSTALMRETRELQEANSLLQREVETLRHALEEAFETGLFVYPRSADGFKEQTREIIAGVDRLVRSSGVSLARLEPQPAEQRGPFAAYPFLVEVRGGFQQICAFLQGVERELSLVPSLFTIEASAKGAEGLRASLRLNAHEWLGQKLVPRAGSKDEKRLMSFSLERDPFVPSGSGAQGERPRGRELVLTGILMVGGKAKAIIDGKAYSAGDVVAGKRILSISQEEVFLEGDPKPLRITRPLKKVGPG
ncbi:MAG: type 4a pilus biogenesis protein PilO [bacterium]